MPGGSSDIIARLVSLNMPDVRDHFRLFATGLELVSSTPEAFGVKYKAGLAKYVSIVRDARIPLQD